MQPKSRDLALILRGLTRLRLISLTAFTALAVGACSGGGGSPRIGQPAPLANDTPQVAGATGQATQTALTTQQTISARIALLAPLSASGQTAQIATGLKQAAELALFEFNNPNLQLIVKDTAGTPEGAAAAATAALAGGAKIIIGPLFASSVRAVAPIARQAQVPVVAFSSDPAVAGNGTYLLSFQPRQEVRRAVMHVAREGRTRFAALVPATAYGKILEAAFQDAVRAAGGVVVAVKTYPPGANGMLENAEDLFKQVAGVVETDDGVAPPPAVPIADALFLPGDSAILPSLGPVLINAGVNPQEIRVFGNGGWDYPNVGRTKAFVGGVFAAPDPRGFQGFTTKYAQAFQSAPPRIASFAFDGISMAAALASRAPKGQRYAATRLTQASGFTGVDGPVRFLASGLSERALAILQVTPNGPVVLEPAPQRFTLPQQTAATGVASPASFFDQR